MGIQFSYTWSVTRRRCSLLTNILHGDWKGWWNSKSCSAAKSLSANTDSFGDRILQPFVMCKNANLIVKMEAPTVCRTRLYIWAPTIMIGEMKKWTPAKMIKQDRNIFFDLGRAPLQHLACQYRWHGTVAAIAPTRNQCTVAVSALLQNCQARQIESKWNSSR